MMPNDYQTVPVDAQMMPVDAQMMPGEAQMMPGEARATSEMLEPDSVDVIVDSAGVLEAGFPESGIPVAHWYPGCRRRCRHGHRCGHHRSQRRGRRHGHRCRWAS